MSMDDITAVATIGFVVACMGALGFMLGYFVGVDHRDPGK